MRMFGDVTLYFRRLALSIRYYRGLFWNLKRFSLLTGTVDFVIDAFVHYSQEFYELVVPLKAGNSLIVPVGELVSDKVVILLTRESLHKQEVLAWDAILKWGWPDNDSEIGSNLLHEKWGHDLLWQGLITHSQIFSTRTLSTTKWRLKVFSGAKLLCILKMRNSIWARIKVCRRKPWPAIHCWAKTELARTVRLWQCRYILIWRLGRDVHRDVHELLFSRCKLQAPNYSSLDLTLT